MQIQKVKDKTGYILYDAELVENPEMLGFDAKYWAEQSAIIGFAEGRGTTFFVQYAGRDYVLRHFRRGGLIAKYFEDEYFWIGLRWTRAWREWYLLASMREMGLPVPQPVACRVIRKGLIYKADLMTRRIMNANTLVDELCRQPLAEGYWVALGSLIRRFHLKGIWHADLNANNIMLDTGGRFYLIDFDRGRVRKSNMGWQLGNLQRLRRSLLKLKKKQERFYFSESDWSNLISGYQSDGLS